MSKIKDILTGWAKVIFKPTTLTPQMEANLLACDSCPARNRHTCSDCGCYIPAKVRSDSDCPQDKWNTDDN